MVSTREWVALLAGCCVAVCVRGNSDGAPVEVCQDLTPQVSSYKQDMLSMYLLTVTLTDKTSSFKNLVETSTGEKRKLVSRSQTLERERVWSTAYVRFVLTALKSGGHAPNRRA